jgi:UDP-N-acetylmuramate dehydrogenase
MPLPPELAAALRQADVTFREDEPLARKTWWRVGGPADAWMEVDDAETLRRVLSIAHRFAEPVFVLGNASNVLVADAGVRGIVLRLAGALAESGREGDTLLLGGGLKLVSLLKRADREEWPGVELFAGIPGTVGGAVRMNAGTKLGEVKDRLVEVEIVHADGAAATLPAEQLHLSYRHSELPPGAIVTAARFRLSGSWHDSRQAIAEHLEWRARTQPTDVPTCGSTFRNPPGDAAGRLIDACGLKGFTIGGAQVSPKHANFVVNLGGATATDLRALIETVRDRVAERTSVLLVPEVIFAGDWPT